MYNLLLNSFGLAWFQQPEAKNVSGNYTNADTNLKTLVIDLILSTPFPGRRYYQPLYFLPR